MKANRWLLRCREFPQLVLYWVFLFKYYFESFEYGNHDTDWNFYLMKLYSEYLVGICDYNFDLEHEYQSLLGMPFALQVKCPTG